MGKQSDQGEKPAAPRSGSSPSAAAKQRARLKPVREKIDEGPDALRRREEWFRRRSGA